MVPSGEALLKVVLPSVALLSVVHPSVILPGVDTRAHKQTYPVNDIGYGMSYLEVEASC